MVKVKLKLRAPLTVAYVRIDKKVYVLEPMKNIELPLGHHKVQWKPSEGQPWIQGKGFTLTEGGKRTLRVYKSGGPKLE
jgi:hypothetical protein